MEKHETTENKMLDSKLQKYGMTRKTLYGTLSLAVAIVLIVVLSLVNAKFSISALKTSAFWTNFAILSGLTILGMIIGLQSGKDMSQNNAIGAFRKALEKYTVIFKKIDEIMLFVYLEDWIQIYRERKKKEKIERLILDSGIKQLEVLDLDLSEIHNLRNPYKKEWTTALKREYGKEPVTLFLSCTEEQIEVLRYCLSGKVKVSDIPKSFFTNATNQSEEDMWEKVGMATKKKSSFLASNFAFKMLGLLAFCVLWSGLGIGTSDSISSGEMWTLLVTRIFTLVTSYIWGIFIGFEYVKIDLAYLEYKISILNQYYDEYQLKIFVPKTIEQVAQEQYEKYEQEQEEAKKMVVIPNEIKTIEHKGVIQDE